MSFDNTVPDLLFQSGSLKIRLAADKEFCAKIQDSYNILRSVIQSGGIIYSCGNGGSTCDAMHLTEELVARYKKNRPGIKAMHLMDASTLTCWSNDFCFEQAFARQVDTFCTNKDVLVAISTSGNSKNIIEACKAAKNKGAKVVALTGKDGGELRSLADISLIVSSSFTERIQETHITIIHIWCELLESNLF